MDVLLLAAGFGTRLRPLTDSIPKCLVPIKDKPLLEYWLESMAHLNASNIYVNTHYLRDEVSRFLHNSNFGNVVECHEHQLLGTAGTLFRQEQQLHTNTDILFAHADNFCVCDWHSFLQAHKSRPKECVMTMMLFEAMNPKSCGVVQLSADGIVEEFHEKVPNPPSNLANGAVYLLSPEFWELCQQLKLTTAADFSLDVLPKLMGRIYTWKNQKIHIDIGTPETYKSANSLVL